MSMLTKNTNNFLIQTAKKFPRLIFPDLCPGCQKIVHPGHSWCSDCWAKLAIVMERQYCQSCSCNLGPHQHITSKNRCSRCDGKTIPLSGICRMGTFDPPIDDAIRRFKYHGQAKTGFSLTQLLIPILKEQEWFDEIDILCPIPMHWTRGLTRRFNHAEMIAEWVSKKTSVPTINLLKRSRLTIQQAALPRAARAENMKNAFLAKRQWNIKNANICLIDDVMTTGATLFEAAKTLSKRKPKNIYAAIIAKSENINN